MDLEYPVCCITFQVHLEEERNRPIGGKSSGCERLWSQEEFSITDPNQMQTISSELAAHDRCQVYLLTLTQTKRPSANNQKPVPFQRQSSLSSFKFQ